MINEPDKKEIDIDDMDNEYSSFLNLTAEEREDEIEIIDLLSKLDKECMQLYFK